MYATLYQRTRGKALMDENSLSNMWENVLEKTGGQ